MIFYWKWIQKQRKRLKQQKIIFKFINIIYNYIEVGMLRIMH